MTFPETVILMQIITYSSCGEFIVSVMEHVFKLYFMVLKVF